MKAYLIITVFATFTFISCCTREQDEQKALLAKTTIIYANMKSLVADCWNKKDMAILRNISTEGCTRTLNGIQVANNQKEVEAAMHIFFTAFPDLNIVTNSAVVKDDQSFTEWTLTGTNNGIFGESPATGKKVIVSGYTSASFDKDGKLTAENVYYNELDLLQQLGYILIPPVVK